MLCLTVVHTYVHVTVHLHFIVTIVLLYICRCGQLGLGHMSNRSDPTLNHYMYTYPVTHVACGDDHTVFQIQVSLYAAG